MARQPARRWWFAALTTLVITLATVLGVQSLGSSAPQSDAAATSHTSYVLTFGDGTTIHFGQLNHLTTEAKTVDYQIAGGTTIEHSCSPRRPALTPHDINIGEPVQQKYLVEAIFDIDRGPTRKLLVAG